MPNEKIISVPFSYVVKHIPRGKRNPVEYSILDEAKVAIPDLTSKEAPTALRFTPKEWRVSEKVADHPWWGDRLWQPWSRVASGEQERAMTVDELLTALENSRDGRDNYYSPFRTSPSKRYNTEFTTLDDLPLGRTRDGGETERSEKLSTISRNATEIILVDGKVYVPAREPVYMIESSSFWGRGRDKDEPALYLKTIDDSEVNPSKTPDTYWRVDRLDEALTDLAEGENRSRERQGLEPWSIAEIAKKCVWNRVEVLIPRCLRFRYDMRPRVDAVAEAAFEGLQEGLAEANVDYFQTYAAFRALMRAEPRDHEAIVAALKGGVADALRPEREHLAERIDGTVKEWINRDDPASIADADLAGLTNV